jgi:predicted Zn-dependent protease
MKIKKIFIFLLIALFFVPQNCFAFKIMIISKYDEWDIGFETSKLIRKEYKLAHQYGPDYDYLYYVGEKIAAASQVDRKMKYRFNIIESEEINAFSTVNYIYITRGLWNLLETEDELAYILGHEIGHTTKQHIRKQVNRALLGGLGLGILLPKDKIVEEGAEIAFRLIQLGFSRKYEYEADEAGVKYMVSAGYNPMSAVNTLKKLGGENLPNWVKYISTHPPTNERIKRIEEIIEKNKYDTTKEFLLFDLNRAKKE